MSQNQNKETELTEDDLEKAVGGFAQVDALRASASRRAESEEVESTEASRVRDADDGSRQIKPF